MVTGETASLGEYRVEVSLNGVNFREVAAGEFTTSGLFRRNTIPLSAGDGSKVRYVRLTGLSTQRSDPGDTGARYLEVTDMLVFGEPSSCASASCAVRSDFNGDGYSDVATGVPGESVGTAPNAGAVSVIYGGSAGLSAAANQLWTQNSGGIADSSEAGDRFGAAVATGDFNSDGFADLVVGAPDEDGSAGADVGVVQVLYGSTAGLTATSSQLWSQNTTGITDVAEAGDRFGAALATAEMGNGGSPDLAVGVPDEDATAGADVGVVHVLYSGAGGLTSAGSQLWSQNASGITDSSEAGDHFGEALAASDLGGGGQADLAVGVPDEDTSAGTDGGVVHVLYGGAAGLSSSASQLWSQNTTGIADSTEAGDRFGAALAVGDVGNSAQSDLAIGAPAEDASAGADVGVVHVLYGGAAGLSAPGSQLWSQNSAGIADGAEAGDHFGASLAVGELGDSGQADLAVGVPGEDVSPSADVGVVQVLYGGGAGLSSAGSQLWSQNSSGVADSSEAGDQFGAAVVISDVGNGSRGDLVIGTPEEDGSAGADVGVAHVLFGTGAGVSATGSQLWSQNATGIADSSESGDRFGAAFG